MRPTAGRFAIAGALLLAVPLLLSGCIVCVDDVFCDSHPSRMATLHVYARDYFTGVPIPWAQVTLYESDWWTWDCLGTWPVNQAGYVTLHCGYLDADGCGGGEEEDFRVVVHAPGYCSERYDIELSYYYPSEVLTFYLVPFGAREDVGAEPGSFKAGTGDGTEENLESMMPAGKVVVGEPGDRGVE